MANIHLHITSLILAFMGSLLKTMRFWGISPISPSRPCFPYRIYIYSADSGLLGPYQINNTAVVAEPSFCWGYYVFKQKEIITHFEMSSQNATTSRFWASFCCKTEYFESTFALPLLTCKKTDMTPWLYWWADIQPTVLCTLTFTDGALNIGNHLLNIFRKQSVVWTVVSNTSDWWH